MNSSEQLPPEPPWFSGRLSETPLFVVVRRLQRERLSGTLSVIRDEQVRQLFFENGEMRAARSSREEHRIGATLVRWGYISEHDLEEALEIQRVTRERIDRILVAKGKVSRVIVDSEARRQMEQVVFSTLAWPDGAFHFERDTGPVDLDVGVSLSEEMIVEGIRRIPESEQFLELLGDLSAVPVLTGDPTSGSFRSLKDAFGMLSQIDGRTNVETLLKSAGAGTARAKILYSLLFAGLIEMRTPESRAADGAGAAAAPRPAPPAARKTREYMYDLRRRPELAEWAEPEEAPPPKATPRNIPETFGGGAARQLVIETYRQLDWLSHYDLLGVPRKATQEEIEEAYRTRALVFDPTLKAHPELVDIWRQLATLSKWLKVAYGVLSDPASRRAYDRKVDKTSPPSPEEPSKGE